MKKTGKPLNRIITYVVVCVAMLSCCLLASIYAKYTSGSKNGGTADVATFVFSATTERSQTMKFDLSEIKVPGDSKQIKVFISNTSRTSAVSEINEAYTCTLKMLGDMPLKCDLTLEGQTSPAVSLDTATKNTGNCEGQFAAGVSKRDTYILNVYWPKEKNDPIYEDGGFVAWLEMEVVCEQTA